jgi:hypothetical protein
MSKHRHGRGRRDRRRRALKEAERFANLSRKRRKRNHRSQNNEQGMTPFDDESPNAMIVISAGTKSHPRTFGTP